ncbi:MAG TPA: thiamine phosphate synthase [Polyangiaceae bacterium]
MRGLYAIVDVGTLASRGLDPVAFAEALLEVRPAALQLRSKESGSRETLALLRALAPLCHKAGVPLVANDRPDFALLAGCDIVHVGQTDMPIERVRRITPHLRVGVSTHTLAQLDAALAARPAYVAYGPVFETHTKVNPDPVVGVDGLRAASARAVVASIPLVGIGGITRARARELVGLVDAVAVVADLVPTEKGPAGLREVTARARELHEMFVGVRAGAAQ